MLTVLPALIGSYRQRFAKVDLRLRELTTSSLVDAIRQGAVDLGFLRDAGPAEDLILETVVAGRFGVAVSDELPLPKPKKISRFDLPNDSLILFARQLGPFTRVRTTAL